MLYIYIMQQQHLYLSIVINIAESTLVLLFGCCPNCHPTIFLMTICGCISLSFPTLPPALLWHLTLAGETGKRWRNWKVKRILLSQAQFLERFRKSPHTHRIPSRHCCQSSHRSCRTPGSEGYSVHCHIWTLQEGRWVLVCGTCAPAHRTHPHSRCRHHRQSHGTRTGRSGRWTGVAGTPGRCSPARHCCPRSRYVDHTWF